jgi:serine protease Do
MKKLIGLLLVMTLAVGSLSSCLLFETDGLGSLNGGSGDEDGVTIKVEGGPTYEEINITSTADKNLLAASKALLSSVSVRCVFKEYQYSWAGTPTGTKETGSAGSGVIYKLDKNSGDAYIITNYHVVYNANSIAENGISNKIYVYLYGMETVTSENTSYAIPAEYVGGSMNYDIAVLKVTDSTVLMESNAMAVTVANSDEVTILDTAIAIGNPEDSGISATVGNINVDSEHIYVRFETASGNQAVELRVMRTDAAVNSGNSGGGLFNDKGELIGIVNAKDADESVDNIGYAIPSNVAKAIADNAIHYSDGTVKRCLLGITVGVKSYKTNYDINTGKIYKLEEVVVTEIASTAAAKGILEVGDVINSITVDGVRCEVSRIHHVVDSMLYARVGSSVTINVTRGGVKADLTLPITESMLTVY